MSVNTVLGAVKAEALGVTLTHEHLSVKYEKFYRSPPPIHKNKFDGGIGLHNVAFVRQYPYSSRTNMDFTDPEASLDGVRLFAEAGGGTIVENTTWGLGRDLQLMKSISKATGVNIIAGTGHYLSEVQTPETLKMPLEEMVKLMTTELTEGCIDDPEVKCGIIGEVASSWPIDDFERRCIVATAMAQSDLKCPVTFHPGRNREAPFEIMRIYSEAGGDLKKAVMSHLDRTLPSTVDLIDFSDLGSYCQFDLFGTEVSFYQLSPETDMPSDGQRLDRIKVLLEAGKVEQILVSHDIHTRHRLVKYGGHGYGHLPVAVKQHMLHKGISQDKINQIMIRNPARWLTA
ncbi:phosphotriesterase-related protein [Halyomorpha halys]|uniref:phosphotriesterase-related protein n=1 Tax=Halyomorpha halys TaxID=286706 RepID=UPI0006D4F708|nr:phosphotriesterase-related protein [Halyomorpha halys]